MVRRTLVKPAGIVPDPVDSAYVGNRLTALTHELAVERARYGDAADANLVAEAEALVARLKAARAAAGLSLPPSGDGERS